jgi:hypothetical protein
MLAITLTKLAHSLHLLACSKDRYWLRPQPVNATHWLNRSAGVSKPNVFLGRNYFFSERLLLVNIC